MRAKLRHSVELIRKAEKIALMYDPENGFYNTFSGGKDSQVLYYIVKMSGARFQTHMSLTSVDPAEVVRFVNTQYPSVIPIRPKISIYSRAIERGILPTRLVRWCCADFKESTGAGKVTLIGIRKEESARRAKRHEVEVSSRKCSGNLDEFERWRADEIARKQSRKTKRKINEDEFSVQSDNEIRCINGKDSILISPIFEWTEKDVWYFLDNIIKAPHCKLYDEGYHRIGCILCPMANLKQKTVEVKRVPYVKEKWINAIKEIRKKGFIKEGFIWWSMPSGDFSRRSGTCSTSNCLHPGHYTEDEIAEVIFDWWISGKPYKQWYAERYLQLKIDFNNEQE